MTMTTKEVASLGGKRMAERQRLEAQTRYLSDPKKCMQCDRIIPLLPNTKVSVTRRKKFCNTSCAATFNNQRGTHRRGPQPSPDVRLQSCSICGKTFLSPRLPSGHFNYTRPCDDCRTTPTENRTKGELFGGSGTSGDVIWQRARATITTHARRIALREGLLTKCRNCGYEKHVETCHIRGVMEFPDTATLGEINAVTNMVGLCPNCHWEFDHQLLSFSIR